MKIVYLVETDDIIEHAMRFKIKCSSFVCVPS